MKSEKCPVLHFMGSNRQACFSHCNLDRIRGPQCYLVFMPKHVWNSHFRKIPPKGFLPGLSDVPRVHRGEGRSTYFSLSSPPPQIWSSVYLSKTFWNYLWQRLRQLRYWDPILPTLDAFNCVPEAPVHLTGFDHHDFYFCEIIWVVCKPSSV